MTFARHCYAALVVLGGASVFGAEPLFDSHVFGDLEARAIGPATMGGRVAALDSVWEGSRQTIYVGSASGGVWKSVNGGTQFKAVFEDHTQSIGAIAIDRRDPKIVWVGTGEPWTRNSVSVGTGIFKSTDAGDSWNHVGLPDSERISKILIHPSDSDTVFVCVTGHLWNANQERGVYKTADGGKTWERILFVDENTGCGDLALDPQEPKHLYAGMWQFRRYPYFFESGGPGSGLYKSDDGGKSWRKIKSGLPEGTLGRIAVAVAPSRPSVVYATIESENTAMYRSDDLGETWRRMGTTSNVESRPFYFSLIVVDPVDHNRVYKPATFTSVSTDAGQTWNSLGGSLHPDHHALWIDPHNIDHLLIGTDGGIYRSNDRGMNWSFLQALPISQFYHVSYDMQDPYYVYGGLQDNGTWMGPSSTPSGIQNKHWDNIGFGDGFCAHVDQQDPDYIYVEWQGGRIQRFRRSLMESKDIQPLPGPGEPKYRFNWNAPIALSSTQKDIVYIGGQFLFRTRDRGESWEKISPDLTTNDPEKQKQIESGGVTPDNSTAENHCTIYAIAESPLNPKVIWAGTDDGNLQITRDGGATWTNVVKNVPGVPPFTWVSFVEAGRHNEGAAYVTFDGHRTGDMKPYVFKTTDYGATWKPLAGGDMEGYALCVREDLLNPDLLFVGTEFGLFVSLDGGGHWARFKNKLPKVAIAHMAIHPREHDLILATHGRGIYIIDDITPLRSLTPGLLSSEVAVISGRPSVLRLPAGTQEFAGDDEFVGANPPSGGQITYYLKKRHMFGDLKLDVLDAQGTVIATLPGGKRRGLNRVSWNARLKGPKVAPAATLVPDQWSFVGPQVAEGAYKVRLTKADQTYEGQVVLAADPRADYTAADRALQDKTVLALYRMVERLTYVVDSLVDLQTQLKDRLAKAPKESEAATALQQYWDDLEAFRKTLVATRKGGFIAGEEQLREHVTGLYGAVNGYEGKPTMSQIRRMEALESDLAAAEKKYDTLTAAPLTAANQKTAAASLPQLVKLTREKWQEQENKR